MSRTCVREAIKSLESLQLISVRPKIGAIVLEPSPIALINAEYLSTSAFMQQADSLIEFRKVLELGLVALAAEKATEEDWASMRQVLAEQEEALRLDRSTPHNDLLFHEAIGKANIRFHKAVAEATRNPLAIMVLQAISEPLIEVSRRTNEMPGVPEADYVSIGRSTGRSGRTIQKKRAMPCAYIFRQRSATLTVWGRNRPRCHPLR